MNKIGIYYAYWARECDTDYLYYLNKVSGLGFDILEVSSAHILEISEIKRKELKKAALDRGIELTYCICFPLDKDIASEDNIGKAIITAGDMLGHLHIGETNRKCPENGHMPWDEIVQALKNIHYSGRIVMEPFVKMGGAVGRDMKVWRDLSEGDSEKQLDIEAKVALEFIKHKIHTLREEEV